MFWWESEQQRKDLQEGIYPALLMNIEKLCYDIDLLVDKEKLETYKNSLRFLARISSETYDISDIPLNFTVDEPTSWIGYSLDGEANLTVTENITLPFLGEGMHMRKKMFQK